MKKGMKAKSSPLPVPRNKLKPAPKLSKLTPAQERAALDKVNSSALAKMAETFGARKKSASEEAMLLFDTNHGSDYGAREKLKVKKYLKKDDEAVMFLTLGKDEAKLYIEDVLEEV